MRPERTSAEDWIKAGYEALSRSGVAGVNIETIAKDLGVADLVSS